MDDFSRLIQNSEKLLELPGGHKGLILKPDMANYGLSLLRNRFDFLQLISINIVSKKQFSELERSEYLMYHIANLYKKQQLFVFVPIVNGKKINSTVSHWKNSRWFERQIYEKNDLNFKDQNSNREIFQVQETPQDNNFKDLSRENFHLRNLKWKRIPSEHKYNIAGKDLFYKRRGRKIVQGYLQIGQDRKRREDLYLTGSIQNTLKDFSLSSQVNYLFSLKIALEKNKGVIPSERHQAISVITLEAHRILDHLQACVDTFQKYKFISPFRTYKKNLEEFKKFFTPSEYDFDFQRHLQYVEDNLIILIQKIEILKKNLPFEKDYNLFKRKIDFGSYRKKELINYGITGILAKASGLRIDSRLNDPFYLYSDLSFEIPLGINGSLYDQFLVRKNEIHQSIKIIHNLFDNLAVKRSGKEVTLQTLLQECPGLLVGQNIEKTNGLSNVILLSKGKKKETLIIRSPDFNQAQFLSKHMNGLSPFQLHQIGKGIGLSSIEIDR